MPGLLNMQMACDAECSKQTSTNAHTTVIGSLVALLDSSDVCAANCLSSSAALATAKAAVCAPTKDHGRTLRSSRSQTTLLDIPCLKFLVQSCTELVLKLP